MPLNLGSLTDADNRCRQSFVEFARSWVVVRENWLDDRCRQFEQERLASVGPALSRFAAALVEFQAVVRKAEAELSDPDRAELG